MKGVSARVYSTNYFQRLTLESWYTNLQQTPLNRCQPRRRGGEGEGGLSYETDGDARRLA